MFSFELSQLYFDDVKLLWLSVGGMVVMSLFVFWRESILTWKNRNSVFDFWFISAIGGALLGRIEFFVVNWDSLKNIPWFWIPYERFDSTIYLFRLYPWRFFRIWDGGFIFAGLLLGYVITVYLLIIFKRGWTWDNMFVPAFNSSVVLFNGILLAMALYTQNDKIAILNILVLAVLLVYTLVMGLLRRFASQANWYRWFVKMLYIVVVLAVDGIMAYLFFFSATEVLWIEQASIFIFELVSLLMIFHYILEKPILEGKSGVNSRIAIQFDKSREG